MAQKEGAETNQMKGKVMAETTTLRDRFAIAWMTGMQAQFREQCQHNQRECEIVLHDRKLLAHEAYAFADAMLNEREMPQSSADKGCVVNSDLEKLTDQIGRCQPMVDIPFMKKYGQRLSIRKDKLDPVK